ncbi:MAG TPA: PKD domain-containing protein [Acidimicrobiales bacterium]|nr:PKD domain-containing protein [Acidimicrobiales bacterium]
MTLAGASLAALVPTALALPLATAAPSGVHKVVPPQPTAWVVYSPGGNTEVVGINVATNAIVGMIKIPNSLGDNIGEFTAGELAITPNGRTAYLAIEFSSEVLPIDLANHTFSTPIKVHNSPVAIAITPNGASAYVLGYLNASEATVVPIKTSNGTAGKAIAVGPLESAGPGGIAVTPNGKTVWVASSENGTISPISVATGKLGTPIAVGAFPIAIAVTPDGTTAWVANSLDNDIVPVDLANGKVGKKVGLAGSPAQLSITPSGQYAFVPLDSPATGAVRVGLGGSHPVQKISLLDPSKSPLVAGAVAVAPAGNMAFFGSSSEGYVTPVGVATAKQTTSIALSGGVSEVAAIAITPDQAPTARFTVKVSGDKVALNASTSSAWFGTIANYAWTFGDGASSHSASATTTHTYRKAGNYTITLIVTDSLGTSTTLVFTGQTVSRNGGPRAMKATVVKIS